MSSKGNKRKSKEVKLKRKSERSAVSVNKRIKTKKKSLRKTGRLESFFESLEKEGEEGRRAIKRRRRSSKEKEERTRERDRERSRKGWTKALLKRGKRKR